MPTIDQIIATAKQRAKFIEPSNNLNLTEREVIYNLARYIKNNSSLTVAIELTAAQILQLFNNPVTLVPLDNNQSINILDVSFYYEFNSTAYTNVDDLVIKTGNTEIAVISKDILTGTQNYYGKALATDPQPISDWADIKLSTKTQNPTLGDGTLKIIVTFKNIF